MDEKKLKEEFQEIAQKLHSIKWGEGSSYERDRSNIQVYSSFLSAKVNKDLLKTIKIHNKIIVGFAFLNLVLVFINLCLILKFS